MADLTQLIDVADSMIVCLTAVKPDMGDMMFGRLMGGYSGETPFPEPADDAGEWFRSSEGEKTGFIFIGGPGGDHHFQPNAPSAIDTQALRTMPPAPGGRLWRELQSALARTQTLLTEGCIRMAGDDGPVILQVTDLDRDDLAEVHARLQAVLDLRDPAAAASSLRLCQSAHMETIRQGALTAARAATAPILGLRARGLASADVWAVAQFRRQTVELLSCRNEAPVALSARLFNAVGHLALPHEALRQGVSDVVGAGQAALVMQLCDTSLERAEAAVQTALNAVRVRDHRQSLYDAAGEAYLAMSIAEVMRSHIAPSQWPDALTANLLRGYVAQTEEIVVRAGHALAVSCINADGRHLAFEHHHADVQVHGAAKADELIEEYWFYPRAARSALLAA